jgi:hypothetical protein
MKVRDICLMAGGATVTLATVLLASTLVNPPKAQAQASSAIPAAGGVSMIVSSGNLTVSGGGNGGQGGTIVLQDSVTRKVTVVAYSYNIWSANSVATPPIILLSTNASFTY